VAQKTNNTAITRHERVMVQISGHFNIHIEQEMSNIQA